MKETLFVEQFMLRLSNQPNYGFLFKYICKKKLSKKKEFLYGSTCIREEETEGSVIIDLEAQNVICMAQKQNKIKNLN